MWAQHTNINIGNNYICIGLPHITVWNFHDNFVFMLWSSCGDTSSATPHLQQTYELLHLIFFLGLYMTHLHTVLFIGQWLNFCASRQVSCVSDEPDLSICTLVQEISTFWMNLWIICNLNILWDNSPSPPTGLVKEKAPSQNQITKEITEQKCNTSIMDSVEHMSTLYEILVTLNIWASWCINSYQGAFQIQEYPTCYMYLGCCIFWYGCSILSHTKSCIALH